MVCLGFSSQTEGNYTSICKGQRGEEGRQVSNPDKSRVVLSRYNVRFDGGGFVHNEFRQVNDNGSNVCK